MGHVTMAVVRAFLIGSLWRSVHRTCGSKRTTPNEGQSGAGRGCGFEPQVGGTQQVNVRNLTYSITLCYITAHYAQTQNEAR